MEGFANAGTETSSAQAALFHEFSIDDHLPADHLLGKIYHFLDLSKL
jgi:hypothetical protein